MNWETLLSFGDSITFGARSYLAYPELCGSMLEASMKKSWHVVNHSTNGFTTMDLTRSLNPELSNYKNIFPSLVTVMIGTNDIKNRVPSDEFRIAYNQLILKLRLISVNNNVLLLKIPRLTQNVFYPYHYSMNDQVHEFNRIIDELAGENALRTLAFEFSDEDYFDGVHLNAVGSRTAAGQLAEFILKDKGV